MTEFDTDKNDTFTYNMNLSYHKESQLSRYIQLRYSRNNNGNDEQLNSELQLTVVKVNR